MQTAILRPISSCDHESDSFESRPLPVTHLPHVHTETDAVVRPRTVTLPDPDLDSHHRRRYGAFDPVPAETVAVFDNDDPKTHAGPVSLQRLRSRVLRSVPPSLPCSIRQFLTCRRCVVLLVVIWILALLFIVYIVAGPRSNLPVPDLDIFADGQSFLRDFFADNDPAVTRSRLSRSTGIPVSQIEFPWERHDRLRKNARFDAMRPLTSRKDDNDRWECGAPSNLIYDKIDNASFVRTVLGLPSPEIDDLIEEWSSDAAKLMGHDTRIQCEMQRDVWRPKQDAARARFRESGKGRSASNPVRVYWWEVSNFWRGLFKSDFAFRNCSGVYGVTSDRVEDADVAFQAPYCSTPFPRTDPDQVVFTVSMEPSLVGEGRVAGSDCYRNLDFMISADRWSDIPLYFDDLRSESVWPQFAEFHGPHVRGKLYAKTIVEPVIRKTRDWSFIAGSFISGYGGTTASWRAFRTRYYLVLEQFINVLSFGGHGKYHCKDNLERDAFPLYHNQKCYMVDRHPVKFLLAFENTLLENYVSEKMCANHFADPRDLALYLNYLAENETAYREFYQWRIDGVDLIRTRGPTLDDWINHKGNNVGFVCRALQSLVLGDYDRDINAKCDHETPLFAWS